MPIEIKFLLWTLVLALVQIALTASVRTLETGLPYNAGPRDLPSPAPVGIITGRLMRAQTNLFETLPIFIGLVLIAEITLIHTEKTSLGAMIYFWSRVLYVPLYAFGIPYARTLVWAASIYGLITLFESLM